MKDERTYRVGDLTDFRDYDPMVMGWDAAMAEAEKQATVDDLYERVIGIWLWEHGDVSLEGIFHQGWVFT